EAETANDFFSPSVVEELGGALHGGDGSEVFEGQHWDHEVAGQRPGDTDNSHDEAADHAHALFKGAQNDADSGGDKRPLKNGALARPCQLKAIAKRPSATHQAAIGHADESHVEEHDDEIVDRVQHKHTGQKQRRLVRLEL